MNERAISWSVDAMMASVMLIASAGLLFSTTAQLAMEGNDSLERKELELKSMQWADAIVKQHDGNNALFGAAHYDAQKKRVESHWIETTALEKASGENREGFFVSALSIDSGLQETVFLQGMPGNDCAAWNRLVMVWETKEKALLHVVVCRER